MLGRGWNELIVMWEIGAHLPALPGADGEAGTACVARDCRSPRLQGRGLGAGRPGRRARGSAGGRRGPGAAVGTGGRGLRGSEETPEPRGRKSEERRSRRRRGGGLAKGTAHGSRPIPCKKKKKKAAAMVVTQAVKMMTNSLDRNVLLKRVRKWGEKRN